ncbi:dermonecrotic toxin domain-containing protein [Pseudomonas sp. MWU13-2105]|uniref:dermonecrotic toxin domain-containing protein n=1 Tax=Pseudomonas sp. MWU13-2105 TaxID=2935074 RepID=UPI00200D0BB7|nr:DUF6543 domain-containing protein [Pseudomonas sp. MWU13-2105]
MTLDSFPYEFSEALEQRDAPNAREKALKITQADRIWLRNVLLPNQTARQALNDPMLVEKIILCPYGVALVDLAGAFLMSPRTQDCSYLYSPSRGLEHFETRTGAIDAVLDRLASEAQRDELLRFVALDIKINLKFDADLKLKTEPIEGAVFLDRRRSIDFHEKHNLQALNEELLKLPGLAALLDKMLSDELGRRFANVNLATVKMLSHANASRDHRADAGEPKRPPAAPHSLSEAILAHYRAGAWPADQRRVFVAPDYNAVSADIEHWENAITKISGSLKTRLQSELESYWNGKMGNGYSRRCFFAEVMGTCWRTELFKQLQWDSIGPRTHYWLAALYPYRSTRLQRTHIKSLGYTTSKPSQAALANAFLVSDRSVTGSLFVYNCGQLLELNGLDALNHYLLQELHAVERRDELAETLSLSELTDLRQFPAQTTQLGPLTQPVFANRLEAIIAKQLENIDYVLTRHSRSKGQLNLAAALEVALDVRQMINSKLQSINSRGDWSIRLDLSTDDQPRPSPLPGSLGSARAHAKEQWRELEILKTRLNTELTGRPGLMAFAQSALRHELIKMKRAELEPSTVYINQFESDWTEQQAPQPITSISLVEYFLERSVGLAPPLAQAPDSGLFGHGQDGSWSRIANLDSATANQLVEAAQLGFQPRFLHEQRSIYTTISALISEALEKGLRYEAQQRVLAGTLEDSARELLESLLDSPDSPGRKGLRGFIADAFGLTLIIDEQSLAHKLFNCFLITERGGLDPLNSGSALVWTPATGLEAFESLHSAESELNRRLQTPDQRSWLLENLAADRPLALRSTSSPHHGMRIGFERIRNNFLSDRVHSVVDKALGDIALASTSPLPAASLQHQLESCLRQHASVAPLEKAMEAAQNSAFSAALPAWLASADSEAQLALGTLLDQYRQRIDEPLDYHHGIPCIGHFAWTKIHGLLIRDFPSLRLNRDAVQLSVLTPDAKNARLLALSDYALLHRDEIDNAAITLSQTSALPEDLTVTHLNSLIKEADIGTHYAALLDSHLSHGESRVPERQALFNPHLIWQSLEHALRQYLRKSLSAQAHGFIKHVLGMPDGVARTLFAGSKIVVRPLELLRRAQKVADTALGLYLIGRPDTQGPLVLYSPYDEHAAFREYPNEPTFINELGRPGALQQLVLDRISSSVRQYYTEQLFSLQAVSVTWNIIKGNFLHRLYNDMTALLKTQLGLQHIKGQHTAWGTVVAMLGNPLHQGARFMLGRLRIPWLIWQTLPQFKDAADNAWQGHWHLAMEEFIGALTQVALSRKAPLSSALDGRLKPTETPGKKPTEPPGAPPTPLTAPFPAQPDWGDMALTQEQQSRLLSHEVHDIALNDLEHDPSLQIYTDSASQQHYACVRGRVFRVQAEDGRWRIVGDQENGPWLRKDAQNLWDMDLKGRLLGGGPINRLVNRISARQTVRTEVKVQAVGMQAITQLYPDKARQLRQAHALAVTYLENARQRLKSLAANTRLDKQRHLYLKEFLGLRSISQSLKQRIAGMLDKLLMELLSPARSPYLSKLYVVGAARQPERLCAAFVVLCDRAQKIYLNELFFEPGLQDYEPIRPRTFNTVLHNMACILIHEFSHVVFDTVDIAYLDAFRPFYDLIDNSTTPGRERQMGLKELQETALSQHTPSRELFKVLDEVNGTWEDINGEPYRRVLKLTRTTNLDDARWEFLYDDARRIDVILANADSLALLFSYLGRPLEFYPIFSGPPA